MVLDAPGYFTNVAELSSSCEIDIPYHFRSDQMPPKFNKTSANLKPRSADFTKTLSDAHKDLMFAEKLRSEGKFDKAISCCSKLLSKFPDYFGALHTLGLIYADIKDFRNSILYLSRAQMVNPQNTMTLIALSGVYSALGSNRMAIQTLKHVFEDGAEDPNALVSLAYIYNQEREYELAYQTYKKALDVEPHFDAANLGFGLAAKQLGRYDEAAEALWRVVRKGSFGLDPIYQLATTRGVAADSNILQFVDKVKLALGSDKKDFEEKVEYIRAEVYLNAGDFNESWKAATRANEIIHKKNLTEIEKNRQIQLDSLRYANDFKPQKTDLSAHGDSETKMVFILGASRSGKTTLEALMANLSDLKRGFENPSADLVIRRTYQDAGLPTSHSFAMLPLPLDKACRNNFMKEIKTRAGGAKIFTNTDPSRIHDALKISNIIPSARFLFVKRNTEDLVARIYMKAYASGNYYSYSIDDILDYVTWYNDMIDVISKKIPELSLVTEYEKIVTDPKKAIFSIADFLSSDLNDKLNLDLHSDVGFGRPFRRYWS
jgi:tetratricopeptide (TPR) repeat protein